MNDQTSLAPRLGDGAPSSPKRKKVRSKYASKACVSCRKSKLKCSGDNPCQRCLESGKRCFYSEDQTAAEALQNLSRPALAQSLGIDSGAHARRNISARHDNLERRASNASAQGLSMEARMSRIENMMESLIQERASTGTPPASVDRDDAVSHGLPIDLIMHGSGDPLFSDLTQVGQTDPRLESPDAALPGSLTMGASNGKDLLHSICIDSTAYQFPAHANVQKYVDFFFSDLSHYYPCINEAQFRKRLGKLVISGLPIEASESCFIALSYVLFACSDIAMDTSRIGAHSNPAGWQWLKLAEKLERELDAVDQGDLSSVQYLALKAAYLMLADRPNAAYRAVGTASSSCFQFGLNQKLSWRNHTPFEIHMSQRVFWTTYILDKRISLSCGRPYCIRDCNVHIEKPAYLFDQELHPDKPLPNVDVSRSSMMYLNSMACVGQLASSLWDEQLAATVTEHGSQDESAINIDNRIQQWTDVVLPTIPLLASDQSDYSTTAGPLRQHTLVNTQTSHLRLLLFRHVMLSLRYDEECGRSCGDLAVDLVQRVEQHTASPNYPNSFRFYIATCAGHALLILSTLLVRDLASIGLQDRWRAYADSFRQALAMLKSLSAHLPLAQRILKDFKDVAPIVTTLITEQQNGRAFPLDLLPSNLKDLFPYRSLDFAQQAQNRDLTGNVDTSLMSETGASEKHQYGVPWI